jgi:hypothetical protein
MYFESNLGMAVILFVIALIFSVGLYVLIKFMRNKD